ncbi:extracellular solute-binding protein [Metabacillus sp. GX 13764]|uniref:ABC transporter substrate-binding protein n=1 Tax=Metabacillus kandeliae TaxID=2900151 RepID=UPI001E602131|nr:extracellular solute-binding protein [Metabacillus kandeliae]MCD7035545.1 extracellular solute-binding protein [Metabacillus kandeliae]
MLKKKTMLSVSIAALLCFFSLSACTQDQSGSPGKITLELFSNKAENVGTFQELIKKFEKENPDIDIELNAPPEADTVLKTRLVKNDMPDMLAIGGNASYRELANAGIFYDFTGNKLLDKIKPSYLNMINLLSNEKKGTFGLPYATNANVAIYSKDKFKKLGAAPPKTWDEFIAILEKAKSANEVPIYFTLKDAWTGMIPWNSLAANLQGDQFSEKKNSGNASFQSNYSETADKMLELLRYGQENKYGYAYNDGNKAFANGTGVIYFQGNWAIPEILKLNPKMNLGVFALPAANDPAKNKLVSGVDVLFTLNKDIKHPKEAQKFLEFMYQEEQAKTYINEQKAFSALDSVQQTDPALEGVQNDLKNEKIAGYPDHYYPRGIRPENLIQEFYIKQDKKAFLEKMDHEWDKVKNRYN